MFLSNQSARYHILLHDQAWQRLSDYIEQLNAQTTVPGAYLSNQLQQAGISDFSGLNSKHILNLLLRTKKPQIFAESAVAGDGSDWNRQELKLLGDIGVACRVTIYDDGRHRAPHIHALPFEGYLLFTAGALLRNGRHQIPADWDVVNSNGQIDPNCYYQLYEQRLLPLLTFANSECFRIGKKAVVTMPGLGCGQFAGPFIGQLGQKLEVVLVRLLTTYREQLQNIKVVYFDPYQECTPKTYDIAGLSFIVNPYTQAEHKLCQLSPPHLFIKDEQEDNLVLFSFVAWDHVSWPGNDFYKGCRVTDDGVKAAATSSMYAMTGIEGHYDAESNCYLPPKGFDDWGTVIDELGLIFEA